MKNILRVKMLVVLFVCVFTAPLRGQELPAIGDPIAMAAQLNATSIAEGMIATLNAIDTAEATGDMNRAQELSTRMDNAELALQIKASTPLGAGEIVAALDPVELIASADQELKRALLCQHGSFALQTLITELYVEGISDERFAALAESAAVLCEACPESEGCAELFGVPAQEEGVAPVSNEELSDDAQVIEIVADTTQDIEIEPGVEVPAGAEIDVIVPADSAVMQTEDITIEDLLASAEQPQQEVPEITVQQAMQQVGVYQKRMAHLEAQINLLESQIDLLCEQCPTCIGCELIP